MTDDRSTYPSIMPDDEGVAVLHWAAGPRSLQIDIEESGPTYLWHRTPSGHTQTITDPVRIRTLTRAVLERVTEEAESADPHWRRSMQLTQ